MRIQFVTGAAVLVLGMLSAGASLAQAQNTDISGSLGSMTCADFTKMAPTAQADAVKQIAPTSLTSNSGGATKTAPAAAAVTGTPLDAGQLVAACQAASPTATVHDAFSSFKPSTSTKK